MATVWSTALDAARRLADRSAEARGQRHLATGHTYLDDQDKAENHLRSALELFGEGDDQTLPATLGSALVGLEGLDHTSAQQIREKHHAHALGGAELDSQSAVGVKITPGQTPG